MKRLTMGQTFFGVILAGLVASGCNGQKSGVKQSPAKDFDRLDEVERYIMQYDSVYGDYLQWTGVQDLGEGDPESVTRKLFLDQPNRFAIKASFYDKENFFTKIPGDISYSGQWTETDKKILLKFYYPPEAWSELFDSLKNQEAIKFIDPRTIELDKTADVIWIMGTECKRNKNGGR